MLGIIIIIVLAILLTKFIIYLGDIGLNNNIDTSQNSKEQLEQLNNRIKADLRSINKGEAEERYIELELLRQNFPKRVLRDMYIPYNGETKQIDVLLLAEFGIYVIECKDYSGWIFGNINNINWRVQYNKNSNRSFYNPIKQNNGHIKALCEFLYLEEKYFKSLIVFSGKAEFKKIPKSTESYKIINDYEINDYINYENQIKTPIFTEEQLDRFYNILLPTTQVSDEVKQKHIENVKKHQIKNS